MSQTEEKIKGCGLLRVSANVWPHLGSPETPEAWHKALLLPGDYEVECVEDSEEGIFHLYILHERIPVVEGVAVLPQVEPYYIMRSNEETGERIGPELTRIDIWYWKDGEFQKVSKYD